MGRTDARPPFLALLGLVACIANPTPEPVPWAELVRGPGSESLRGGVPEELVLRASGPREDVPLHSGTLREVAARVRPTVVSLYTFTLTREGGSPRARQLARDGVLRGEALGSAFFVHERGLLLTNAHVVEDGRPLEALDAEGRRLHVRTLCLDPLYDLALLEVVEGEGPFPALPMGDSLDLAAGDLVLALGNPLGLGPSVSAGVVSQTGRQLGGGRAGRAPRYLQSDCAINLGSSGGPLVTVDGAWVGVNTAVAAGSQGIGFSVPSAQVLEFLAAITADPADPAP